MFLEKNYINFNALHVYVALCKGTHADTVSGVRVDTLVFYDVYRLG